MPHFIIDCSQSLLDQKSPSEVLEALYQCALYSDLFEKEGSGGIKVRINPYDHYLNAGKKEDFIHVFGHIMEGRSSEQKKSLSLSIVKRLNELFPETTIISMNVEEFKKESYGNKSMV